MSTMLKQLNNVLGDSMMNNINIDDLMMKKDNVQVLASVTLLNDLIFDEVFAQVLQFNWIFVVFMSLYERGNGFEFAYHIFHRFACSFGHSRQFVSRLT